MDCRKVYDEAMSAAMAACNAAKPVPMVVGQAAGLFSNKIVPGTEEFVADGVCGFAWVNVKPARGEFIKFCKQNNLGRKDDYYGGWTFWMGMGNQSMQRKEAAGRAFAEVLRNYGLNAYMSSRMD